MVGGRGLVCVGPLWTRQK